MGWLTTDRCYFCRTSAGPILKKRVHVNGKWRDICRACRKAMGGGRGWR